MATTRTALEPNAAAPDPKAAPPEASPDSTSGKDKAEESKTAAAAAAAPAAAANAPLAPPPKPSQTNAAAAGAAAAGDSAPGQHANATAGAAAAGNASTNGNGNGNGNAAGANGQGSHFSLEPNPFEQSFGAPSTDTPNKFGGLPSVASLTSPAPLGPGGTPNWQGSLRSGPLSPAMLTGPTGGNGYFDSEFRGSFPTPNESSLRTGLTPGGGGSMFPAPSPNSQAIFNSLQSGGATPGTLDFHRTAMNAAARSKDAPATTAAGAAANGAPTKAEFPQPAQQAGQNHQDPFTNQPESDAVNSLYMLANTGTRNANQFAVPPQPHQQGAAATAPMQQRMGGQDAAHGRGQKGQSIGSLSGSGMGEYSDDEKPSARGSKKKGSSAKAGKSARKAEDTPSKQPASKRAKGGMHDEPPSEDDDMDMNDDVMHSSGRKMTDEEKRKNFLERNRVAALKCRQRKKQWLANLQTKVEIFTSENDALSAQCTQLREEVVHLKTLLLAHKDCPVSHQQGLGGNAMAQVMGDFNPHNPYGMMGNGQMSMGMQPGQGMQRR